MKKYLILTLVLVMAFQCAAVFAEGEDTSLEYILDKGTFILGFDENFPPMGFRDENNVHVGFDIDLAGEVCARLGVELVLQPIDWPANELELNSKSIDCIWNGMTITEKRQESLTISQAYMANAQVLVVISGSDIQSSDDLAGKTLGLQAGSSAVTTLDDPANAEFKAILGDIAEFDDYMVALMDLKNGGVDALLIDKVVGNYYMSVAGDDYVMLEEELAYEEYGIGFRKGEIALCTKIDEIIKEISDDGTLKTISDKWFENDVTIVAVEDEAATGDEAESDKD